MTQAAYALPAQGTDVTATPTMELDGCSTFCIDSCCIDNSQLDIDNRSIAMVYLF
jgi:hypothetical protein